MPTDTNVNSLVINKLTKAQYDAIENPSDTELYFVPDEIDAAPTSGSNNPVTSDGVYTALSNKAEASNIPTESTVTGWGFTKNSGTVSSVTVNGITYSPTNGDVNLGTISGGGSSGITEINHGTSDTSFALTPNVLHVWGTVSSLTLTLGTGASGIMNEYMFQFTSGSTATTLSLPSSVKWITANTIEANKTYQVSILNNLAVMGGA